jgi:replicative DNA helicase
VIVLAQLNREIDKTDRDPRLSDLRDSGEIEQDADVVAFVCKTQEDGVSKVVVAKHRHAKPGECRLLHRGELSRFDNMAHGYTPPPTKASSREY